MDVTKELGKTLEGVSKLEKANKVTTKNADEWVRYTRGVVADMQRLQGKVGNIRAIARAEREATPVPKAEVEPIAEIEQPIPIAEDSEEDEDKA